MKSLDELLDLFGEPPIPPPPPAPKVLEFPFGREWYEVLDGRKAVKFSCISEEYTAYCHNDGEVWILPNGKPLDSCLKTNMTAPQINYYIRSKYWL